MHLFVRLPRPFKKQRWKAENTQTLLRFTSVWNRAPGGLPPCPRGHTAHSEFPGCLRRPPGSHSLDGAIFASAGEKWERGLSCFVYIAVSCLWMPVFYLFIFILDILFWRWILCELYAIDTVTREWGLLCSFVFWGGRENSWRMED